MKKNKPRLTHQRILDPISDNPDWLRVSSARRMHDIYEQLENFEHPLDRANEKLAGIEDKSQEMYELSTQVAVSSERTSRRAISIGVLAIVIAVLMTFIQIAYNEFWRVPNQSKATEVIISDLMAEISDLKKQQILTLENFSNAASDKEQNTISILEDIRDALESPDKD